MPKSNSKKSLVIVESPAKAKTINKYLGSGFIVKASMGHVRDLPPKGLNVDIENDFEPTYEITPGKKRTVISLKAAAMDCSDLYLATDLDREGEAIAWHLAEVLGVPKDRIYRVIFNAVTKTAITRAFDQPGRIDMDKVNAQQARRILDRIVGYKISPLLWKKVARGLSAGRVQSVATKMIVEREREIRDFKPEEYWHIPAVFSTDMQADYQEEWLDFATPKTEDGKPPTVAEQNKWLAEHNAFKAELNRIGDKKFEASTTNEAHKVFDALKGVEFKLADIQTKESISRPTAPFITSTLQQAAANRMGFTTKRTMRVAQQLYEGIDLGSMGHLGLITYMRTDSTHISPEALDEARSYIFRHIGPEYLPKQPNIYTSKENAQQAHEAIRPTDVDFTPADIKPFLTDEQFKLYDLIWRRFVASQMKPSKSNITILEIVAETSIGPCYYKATGRVLVFDGFTRIWPTNSNGQQLPPTKVGQSLAVVDITAEQHFTKPPARYTEGSLVKALEKEGIGRPSTYASIISTIQDRKYVEKQEKKFFATDLAEVVTDKLNEYFPRIMDIAFTRHMEAELDKIEEQNLDWLGVLKDFYGPFKENLDTATEEMKHAKAEVTPSEYTCPKCEQPLVYRFGKNGMFLSCSAYPNCQFACPCPKDATIMKEVAAPKENIYLRMPIERVRADAKYGVKLAQQAWRQREPEEAANFLGEIVIKQSEQSELMCSACGKPMVYKNGRYGPFLGCSGYPDCRTILNIDKDGNVLPPKPPPEPTDIRCHKCKEGLLVIRQGKKGPFLGCGRFPKCRTIISIKQLDHLKKLQAEGQWPPKTLEEADLLLGRKKAKKKVAKTQ